MKTISVVSPCYMEEANVENCYRTVKAIFEEHLPEYRLEHIFVDNCSTDETVNILRELAQNDTGVKVVVNSRNFGSYRSAFNGLKFATGDAGRGHRPGADKRGRNQQPGPQSFGFHYALRWNSGES